MGGNGCADMITAVALWATKVPILIALTLIAYLIAPFLALFVVYAEESETTGHPSLVPGYYREFLPLWCRIFQSPDAPLDEYYFAEYEMDGFLQRRFRKYYFSSAAVRWAYRVAWLWRNPAYGFGEYFGYDGEGLTILSSHGSEEAWYSGKSSVSYWTAINAKNQKAFYVQIRIYFYKNHCLDILAGYKFFSDPTIKYVAMRFNPFRKYPK